MAGLIAHGYEPEKPQTPSAVASGQALGKRSALASAGTSVEVPRQLRQEMAFLLIGWALLPGQFHLLLKPEPAEASSRLMPRDGLGA